MVLIEGGDPIVSVWPVEAELRQSGWVACPVRKHTHMR